VPGHCRLCQAAQRAEQQQWQWGGYQKIISELIQ
jgi:hypothetical protein